MEPILFKNSLISKIMEVGTGPEQDLYHLESIPDFKRGQDC